jgi:prepilin-type N-terminal cleavage/methylation domain-containing protein
MDSANSEIPTHRLFGRLSNQPLMRFIKESGVGSEIALEQAAVLEENMKNIAYQTKSAVRGFTLIELLVVISIIGILVG